MIHLLDGSTYNEPREKAPGPDLPSGCMWDRPVPAEWQARLYQLFPPNDRISWLELVWFPADPIYSREGVLERYDPVQRWVLYQVVPRAKIPPAWMSLLSGPPPSKDNRIPLSYAAWKLFQDKQVWGQPYWIIQGDKGGHKHKFTDTERKILRAEGLPDLPPCPGELPYADFDERTVEMIAMLDHVRVWNRAQDYDTRDLAEDEAEATRAMRIWLLNWLEVQVDKAIDESRTWKRPLEIATSSDAPRIDYDAEREKILSA